MKVHRHRVESLRVEPSLQAKSGVVHQDASAADAFLTRSKRLLDLASSGGQSDRQFVTDLYRTLLRREPDAAGLRAHLSGLERGATREQVVRTFIDSDEFRQLQSRPRAEPAPVAEPGETRATAAESFKRLIAADIKAAYGREATAQDYDYWLPKLMGPNDSGFVTSGQMSATEYWHRRMLGWQAGGNDIATQGPYAGSSDAHGPVPSASEVVPGVPADSGLSALGGTVSPQLEQAFRLLIATDIRTAYRRDATDEDYAYWLPKLCGGCDSALVSSGQMTSTEYWHQRLLGWQAGGADMAIAGPFAGSSEPRGPVPPATSIIGPTPW